MTATLPGAAVVKTAETTDSHPILAAERDAVATGLSALVRAVRALEGRIPDEELRLAQSVRDRAEQRLKLSATHTVVALAGSTGSGKSSLFNVLTGLELSKVDVRRPTTDTAYACVWGPKGAAQLLDWLGIEPQRQMARESALDADEQAELRGLVLLDLPDHDSTVAEHQVEVDRLVERVDMLVWVVDPQKYADAAIHERYLKALAGRDALVMIVLNHCDSLTEEETKQCLADLRALLVADGLPQVNLIATSATRGDGIADLRASLVEAVNARVASMGRLRADLDDVARSLAVYVGPPARVELDRADVKALQYAIEVAAGVPALTQQAEDGYRSRAQAWTSWPAARLVHRLSPGADTAVSDMDDDAVLSAHLADEAPAAANVQYAQVIEAARELAENAAGHLPAPWPPMARAAAVARAPQAARELDEAVGAVPLRDDRLPGWWWAFGVAQWLVFATLLVGSAWLITWSALEAFGKDIADPPAMGEVSLPSVLVLAGLIIGPLLGLLARPAVKRGARRARERVESALREAATAVSRDHIIAPLRAELSAYEDAREAVTTLHAVPEAKPLST